MANRYWVGGSGTWNSTNTNVWSASSGGASGASVPTAADSVIFDQAGTYTATLTGGGIVCLDITVSAGTVTIAGTGGITISGSMSLSASTVWSHTGTILFNATTTGKTITTNGVSLSTSGLTFNGVGGSWQLQSAVTLSATSATVTHTNGTLDLNNKTITSFYFASNNTNTRTIAFGTTGSVVITGAATSPTMILALNSTGLTFTGTPTFSFTSSSGTIRNVQGAGFSEALAPNYNLSGTGTFNFSGSQAFKNFNTTGYSGNLTLDINSQLTCYGSVTISATTTFGFGASNGWTFAGSGTNTLDFGGVSFGTNTLTINGAGGTWSLASNCTFGAPVTFTAGTLDLNGKTLTTPSFASSNSNVRTIAFGTGNITTTTSGTAWNTGTVTNLTITGTPTVNISYSGASAVTINSGSPTEANAVNFNFTAGTYTLTLTSGNYYGNLDFTGFAGSWSYTINGTTNFWRGVTLSTGMTPSFTSSNGWTFAATTGTHNINLNGKSLGAISLTFNGAGGTWRLQNDLTVNGTTNPVTLTNGTIDLNGYSFITGTIATGVGTKNITFNGGTVQLSQNGTAWSNANPTGFTTTAGTGTGKFSLTSASAKTFAGGGSVYNCNLSNDGTGALTVTGSNTFIDLNNSTTARTYTFTAGTTTTFTNLSFTGAAANLITIGSSSTATYTFSQSGGTVSCDYISISRCVATGGAAFYAGANSTNGGTNTGWTFSAAPATGANLNTFFFAF